SWTSHKASPSDLQSLPQIAGQNANSNAFCSQPVEKFCFWFGVTRISQVACNWPKASTATSLVMTEGARRVVTHGRQLPKSLVEYAVCAFRHWRGRKSRNVNRAKVRSTDLEHLYLQAVIYKAGSTTRSFALWNWRIAPPSDLQSWPGWEGHGCLQKVTTQDVRLYRL